MRRREKRRENPVGGVADIICILREQTFIVVSDPFNKSPFLYLSFTLFLVHSLYSYVSLSLFLSSVYFASLSCSLSFWQTLFYCSLLSLFYYLSHSLFSLFISRPLKENRKDFCQKLLFALL